MCIPRTWQREQQERSEQERTRRQLDAPLVSHSIALSYADAGELQKDAGKAPEPKGKFVSRQTHQPAADSDNQTVVETLQRWAAQMDIPVEQVELRRIL